MEKKSPSYSTRTTDTQWHNPQFLMENMDKGLTVPKWVLMISRMRTNLSSQIVFLGPKVWDFDEKRLYRASVVWVIADTIAIKQSHCTTREDRKLFFPVKRQHCQIKKVYEIGGIISKKFFHFQKSVPNHYPKHYPPKENSSG